MNMSNQDAKAVSNSLLVNADVLADVVAGEVAGLAACELLDGEDKIVAAFASAIMNSTRHDVSFLLRYWSLILYFAIISRRKKSLGDSNNDGAALIGDLIRSGRPQGRGAGTCHRCVLA